MMITSLQNPRIKNAVRLRDRRGRQRQGRMILDGIREITRAAESGVDIVEAYFCATLCDRTAEQTVAKFRESSVNVMEVSESVFQKLAFGQRGEGIVAVATIPERTLDGLVLPDNALIAVLEKVEKPGNVGAVLRSADAAGIAAVLLADPQTDLYNPNAIRASLGAIFSVPVVVASGREIRDWLVGQKFQVFAALVDGSVCYTQADFRGRSAIVLGSEADGLSDLWRSDAVHPIRLPMLGIVDSLNVSVTAGVLFFEALRQRQS